MYPRQIKVYFASKLRHAEKLKALRTDGFHFCARWLDTGTLASNSTKPVSHWLEENFIDIANADAVICLAEPGEVLKTALVEVGWAMAHQRQIFTIGAHPSYDPWNLTYSRVKRVQSIPEALASLKRQFTPPSEIRDLGTAGTSPVPSKRPLNLVDLFPEK